MYSSIAKSNYEYKDIPVIELRERLLRENNLNALTILKGYHELSNVNLKYTVDNTDEEEQICSEIDELVNSLIANDLPGIATELYMTKFNTALEELKKVYDAPDLMEKLKDKDWVSSKGDKDFSSTIRNAIFKFTKDLDQYVYYNLDKEAVNKLIEKANEIIVAKYTDKFSVSRDSAFFKKYTLPSSIELNNLDFDDDVFNNVTYEREVELKNGEVNVIGYHVYTYFDAIVPNVRNYISISSIKISMKIPHDKVIAIVVKAIEEHISKVDNITEIAYLQNIEAQPITINVNTKTGKYELIDGYKRLFYSYRDDFKDVVAPVRIFTDLDDAGFFALLYAANMWKGNVFFHDRGYLFALKSRFNFDIPTEYYKSLLKYRNDLLSESVLTIFKLYDFDTPKGLNMRRGSFMTEVYCKNHLINDMTFLYNRLFDITNEDHGYDRNIAFEIRNQIISLTGLIRTYETNVPQNELTDDLIRNIFNNSTLVKLCCKKHLSTHTYVQNFFFDKKIYDLIATLMKEALMNG